MSYSTLKYVCPNGDVVTKHKYSNAWGFQPFVWSALCEKVFGQSSYWLTASAVDMAGGARKLWDLYKDLSLPVHWRTTLMATLDWAIIEKEKLAEMADHFELFYKDFAKDSRVCCHLPHIAQDFRHPEAEVLGMAFYGTSVSEDMWWQIVAENPETGERDSEPYNINTGTKHFMVFAEMQERGLL